MPRKLTSDKWRPTETAFRVASLPTDIFRAGDVARILGIEKWRLEKFLTGKHYRLTPAGRLGRGQGSWRLFSHQDLYRIGIASWMVRDGFTAKFVSFVLQEIDDSELLQIDERGETNAPDFGIFRTNTGPAVDFIGGRMSAENKEPYYVLKVPELIADINKRIHSNSKGE